MVRGNRVGLHKSRPIFDIKKNHAIVAWFGKSLPVRIEIKTSMKMYLIKNNLTHTPYYMRFEFLLLIRTPRVDAIV